MDLVWIVLSCQATQAERPDSLTQSKPNPHMVLLHSAQHFLSSTSIVGTDIRMSNLDIRLSNLDIRMSSLDIRMSKLILEFGKNETAKNSKFLVGFRMFFSDF